MFTTYAQLKTKIAAYLDDDSLEAHIEDFIGLCEAELQDVVRIRELLRRSRVTITDADDRFLSLPTGFKQMETFRLLTDPVTVLRQINLFEMNGVRSETPRKPTLYAIHEEIEFDAAPEQSYSAEMIYYYKFTPLSDENDSNPMLIRAPGLYLYGSLLAAEPFLVNDERIATWEKMYNRAFTAIKTAEKRAKYTGDPLVPRARGVV